MHRQLRFALFAFALAGLPLGAAAQDKVIYHFDAGLPQATKGLRNISNHLEVSPDAKLVAVTHAQGVDFLMKGATDPNGNKYEDIVERLARRGVKFQVCEITLRNRKLDRTQFIHDVEFVPSGVVEIGKLQQRQGFAYLKP
jgi:intracellular sulfur oxidation DsrE/DsrF family protein